MCISKFQNCTDGSKDPLFSRRPFIQSFLNQYLLNSCFLKKNPQLQEMRIVRLRFFGLNLGREMDIMA